MELTIKIKLDNDAYVTSERIANAELMENLMLIINKMSWGDTNGVVLDSNGNKTGYWIRGKNLTFDLYRQYGINKQVYVITHKKYWI